MPNLHLLVIPFITGICSGSLTNMISETPLGLKQIQTKENTIVKIVQPQENLEYPGRSNEALTKIDEKWSNYYACLNDKFQHQKERKLIVIQLMEGQYTLMKCSFCQRPFEENAKLEWRYKPLTSEVSDSDEPEILDLARQMKLTNKMNLKIYNAIVGYSGLYACYYGNNAISVYILEVVKDQQMSLLNELPLINDTLLIADRTNLVVYYLWSKWSECSSCDAIGKKFKYGICMVKVEEPNERLKYAPINWYVKRETKHHIKHSKKTKKNQGSFPLSNSDSDTKEIEIEKEILNKFETGIPCTSNLLPYLFRSLVQSLKKTAVVAMVEYCKVACLESTIFEVIDKEGRVLETANNTAGIFSSYQVIPKTAPDVERETVTAEFGTDIVLQCPGNLYTDTPYTWKIDKQLLIPELIANDSNGRITIDLLNRLHITHLRLKDSNVYSCWQRDKLAGTVTLNVDKNVNLSYDHHTMLISMLLIAITFLYIGIKILTREIKMRKLTA